MSVRHCEVASATIQLRATRDASHGQLTASSLQCNKINTHPLTLPTNVTSSYGFTETLRWMWSPICLAGGELKVARHCNNTILVLWLFLGTFAKQRKTIIKIRHVCPSVRMEQLGLPLDGFSWNFVYGYFSKLYRRHSSFIKIWEE